MKHIGEWKKKVMSWNIQLQNNDFEEENQMEQTNQKIYSDTQDKKRNSNIAIYHNWARYIRDDICTTTSMLKLIVRKLLQHMKKSCKVWKVNE